MTLAKGVWKSLGHVIKKQEEHGTGGDCLQTSFGAALSVMSEDTLYKDKKQTYKNLEVFNCG